MNRKFNLQFDSTSIGAGKTYRTILRAVADASEGINVFVIISHLNSINYYLNSIKSLTQGVHGIKYYPSLNKISFRDCNHPGGTLTVCTLRWLKDRKLTEGLDKRNLE